MTSKREDILDAVQTILASTAGVSGRVFRGRPYAARLEESPCIFLSWTNDVPDYDNLSTMDWVLQLKVVIVTRGDEADELADPIAVSVYNLLMADRQLSGKAMDVLPGEQRMDIIEGDKPVGMLTGTWFIKHRTAQNTLDA